MNVGFLSYPMLFQNTGGLQIQILETAKALRKRGIEITLVNPITQRLNEFDLIHVFGAINGNHRISEQAKAFGLPVAVSPLLQPHWTKSLGRRARFFEKLIGRATHWEIKTEFRHIESFLLNSDIIIALGTRERNSIESAFSIKPEKIRVIPNGVPQRFFQTTPNDFCLAYNIASGFILCVGTISEYKNQLTVARATVGSGRALVLIGPTLSSSQHYLGELLDFPHVRHIGPLDHESPLLCSAYAAASIFCLTSLAEVMPLSVLEALAADTPVVMTKNHCMDLDSIRTNVAEVEPMDERAVRNAIEFFLAKPPTLESCQRSVKHYSWDAVAESIQQCYEEVLSA